jgi:hypothetical protein
LRGVDADEAAHRFGSKRDLVAGERAEPLRAQRHERVLDGAGLGQAAGREVRRQRREALALLVRLEQPPRRPFGTRQPFPG